jgi:hypothetical protein
LRSGFNHSGLANEFHRQKEPFPATKGATC